MKDFFGEELYVGDTVVFALPYHHHLAKAKIDHFGKIMVVMDVTVASTPTGIKPMSEASRWDKAICRYPEDCVKVEDTDD